MTTDFFQIEIANAVNTFEKISLKEMDGVKLMNRVDVKYLVPIHLLPRLLCEAQKHYRILEINNERLCAYQTLYYDTPTCPFIITIRRAGSIVTKYAQEITLLQIFHFLKSNLKIRKGAP